MPIENCWHFYRQMDFAKSQKTIYCLVLNMCMKKAELLVWMYIFMLIVLRKQIVSQIFHSIDNKYYAPEFVGIPKPSVPFAGTTKIASNH